MIIGLSKDRPLLLNRYLPGFKTLSGLFHLLLRTIHFRQLFLIAFIIIIAIKRI